MFLMDYFFRTLHHGKVLSIPYREDTIESFIVKPVLRFKTYLLAIVNVFFPFGIAYFS